jgi:hypothetical protein
MWYHPVAENPVDRARKAWEAAGAAVGANPRDVAKAEAERRARARYEAALRAAGLTPMPPPEPERLPAAHRRRPPARSH